MDFYKTSNEEVNPIELKKYINKIVKVKVIFGKLYEGIVYTVDPISKWYVQKIKF